MPVETADVRARLITSSDRAQLVAAASLTLPNMAIAGNEATFGLQTPQAVVAHQSYDLHTIVLGMCILIVTAVFGFMFYAIVRHRRSVGKDAKQFHGNTLVEILWTAAPCLIVLGTALPATRAVIAMKDTSSPNMTVKVTGYQWKWGYEYLGKTPSIPAIDRRLASLDGILPLIDHRFDLGLGFVFGYRSVNTDPPARTRAESSVVP